MCTLRTNTRNCQIPHQILAGTTWHARKLPAQHSFSYPYRYWAINLTALVAGDRLPEVKGLFSMRHKAVQQFCPSDYLTKIDNGKGGGTIADSEAQKVDSAQALLQRLNQQFMALTGSQPSGEVLALVVCRNLGLYFSPVNFYLGFDIDGGRPTHLLAEVSNTPWDKRHHYAFLLDGEHTEFSHDKNFHVSPFNPIDQRYRWLVDIKPNAAALVDDRAASCAHKTSKAFDVSIGIYISDERGEVFAAGVKLAGEPMRDRAIKAALKTNPIMNFTSVAQIYWHALKLFAIKRVPYVDYAATLRASKQSPKLNKSLQQKKSPQLNQQPDRLSNSQINQQLNQKLSYSFSPSQGQGMSMLNQNETDDPVSTTSATSFDSKAQKTTNAPTDRSASSKLAKISNRLSQSLRGSQVLQPIDKGINQGSRKAVRSVLSKLQYGQLTIVENFTGKATKSQFGKLSHEPVKTSSEVGDQPLKVTLTVHDVSVYRQLLFGGSIALADSYINGEWDTDDLTGLIRLAARNMRVVNNLDGRLARVSNAFERAKHRLRSNDQATAKSNILAHYDLGNTMYQCFLDPTMMYSSAVYPAPDSTLTQAQQYKLKLICDQLQLSETDRVIEIGTGWGGFAIYAARHYGCHVTTTTISDAQFEEASRRINEAGLSDRITLVKQDYRELSGQYDKLVSIEMIEAVGHEYLPTFFEKCSALLKPTGRMVLQAITFNDQGYKDYIGSVDFIQTHIFPGGCLLSNQEIINRFTEQTDMVVKSLIDYGYDYAHTLRDWRQAFFANQAQIRKLGYDEAFMRLWRFYFCYCEAGFLERSIGVVQVTAIKPNCR